MISIIVDFRHGGIKNLPDFGVAMISHPEETWCVKENVPIWCPPHTVVIGTSMHYLATIEKALLTAINKSSKFLKVWCIF